MFRGRFAGWTIAGDGANLSTAARYPSGKGEVCKTFIRRFDSDPRLHFISPPHFLQVASGCHIIRSWKFLAVAGVRKKPCRDGNGRLEFARFC
jgi:hypothetical protein